jgi:hypothetical protein
MSTSPAGAVSCESVTAKGVFVKEADISVAGPEGSVGAPGVSPVEGVWPSTAVPEGAVAVASSSPPSSSSPHAAPNNSDIASSATTLIIVYESSFLDLMSPPYHNDSVLAD